MVFKKSFDTEREAKQQAWGDLPTSMKPDDNFAIQIVHTSQPVDETPIIISTPEDWIDIPNSGMLYIIENTLSTCSIWVVGNKRSEKWETEIALNPIAYGYDDAIANLLSTGWSQHDIPFHENVLTDTELEKSILYKVYTSENKGERLSTKDINEALGILLPIVEDGRSDYLIFRKILEKLQKEGLVSSFGRDSWYITDKGRAGFQ